MTRDNNPDELFVFYNIIEQQKCVREGGASGSLRKCKNVWILKPQ